MLNALLCFIGRLIPAYLVVFFGTLVLWEVTGVIDREGSKAMALAFVIAPVGAIATALVWPFVRSRYSGKPSSDEPAMSGVPSATRRWTFLGLTIALFGIPGTVTAFRIAGFTSSDWPAIIVRELAILALVAGLVWIVLFREKQPLSSIGLRAQPIVPTIAWSLVALALFILGIASCLFVFSLLGLGFGSSSGTTVPLGVSLLVYARAGIAEELFYRGYAIERIETLTRSPYLACAVPLVVFAGSHVSQGAAGILMAVVLGAIASAIYLWKRNLLILIIAHLLVDLLPNVILPMVFGK